MNILDYRYNKVSGIYKITCNLTQDCYIGSACDLYHRAVTHRRLLKINSHKNIHLQRAYSRYGENSFVIEVVCICVKEELLKLEQALINFINPSYNIARIAGNSLGIKRREETKEKIRQVHLGRKHTANHIESRIAWRRGVKQADRTIEKRRVSLCKPIEQLDVNRNLIRLWPSFKSTKEYYGSKILWPYINSEKMFDSSYWRYKNK